MVELRGNNKQNFAIWDCSKQTYSIYRKVLGANVLLATKYRFIDVETYLN